METRQFVTRCADGVTEGQCRTEARKLKDRKTARENRGQKCRWQKNRGGAKKSQDRWAGLGGFSSHFSALHFSAVPSSSCFGHSYIHSEIVCDVLLEI
jgi:hypothetical protein